MEQVQKWILLSFNHCLGIYLKLTLELLCSKRKSLLNEYISLSSLLLNGIFQCHFQIKT